MILYHGTTESAKQSILSQGINTKINIQNELDFGYGFYLSDYRFARKTAIRKAKMAMLADDDNSLNTIPSIVAVEIDVDGIRRHLSRGEIRVYRWRSLKFLKDVFRHREHTGDNVETYKFVISPMADGFVDTAMQWYKEKKGRFRKIVCLFRYWIPVFHTQYVIKDQTLVGKYVHVLVDGGKKNEQRIKGLQNGRSNHR